MEKRQPNDLNAAVPKFCLALEEFRRTNDGRVRTSQELLQHFFPHDQNKSTDRLFRYLPNEVRGPVLTTWGLRGAKSALKDTDEKVQSVVWDALLAGDIDHEAFESAITHDMLVRWVPLGDWWTFWRAGKLSKLALLKALDTAYELALFDAKWFFDTIEGPGGEAPRHGRRERGAHEGGAHGVGPEDPRQRRRLAEGDARRHRMGSRRRQDAQRRAHQGARRVRPEGEARRDVAGVGRRRQGQRGALRRRAPQHPHHPRPRRARRRRLSRTGAAERDDQRGDGHERPSAQGLHLAAERGRADGRRALQRVADAPGRGAGADRRRRGRHRDHGHRAPQGEGREPHEPPSPVRRAGAHALKPRTSGPPSKAPVRR